MDIAELEDEFPRAVNHPEAVEEKIMAFEAKYSTPVNFEDLRGIYAEVHADHEDCACGQCDGL